MKRFITATGLLCLTSLLFTPAFGAIKPKSLVDVLKDGPNCEYSLEIMFLHDWSGSMKNDIDANTINLYKQVLNDIKTQFPQSLIGALAFVDKPLLGFGIVGIDYCEDLIIKVSSGSTDAMIDTLFAKPLGKGADYRENQMGVLYNVSKNADFAGFSSGTVDKNGNPIVRVVVMITNSSYHIAGDALKLEPNDDSDWNDCLLEDYPTIEQTGQALVERGVYTVIMAPEKKNLHLVYNELLEKLGSGGAVYPLQDLSSDLIDRIVDSIVDLNQGICVQGKVLDIVFAQDVTSSYNNDMPVFTSKMSKMILDIRHVYNSPRFALTSIGDKPLRGLGDLGSGDYCYKLEKAFTLIGDDVSSAAAALAIISGSDFPEGQVDGVISTLLDNGLIYRLGKFFNGMPMFRIVVLGTDSSFHLSGDALKHGHKLAPYKLGVVNCTNEEYAHINDLGKALVLQDANPLFVVTGKVAKVYINLVQYLKVVFGVIGRVEQTSDFGDLSDLVMTGTRRLIEQVQESRQ